MNRLLSVVALLLSLCALVASFLLWREVHPARLEAISPPLHHQITDEQFGRIKDFVDYIRRAHGAGTLARSDVLTADQLLNKARFMHGDITREEGHYLLDETEGERMHLGVARFQAGATSIDEILLLQDDILESSR